MAAAIAIFQPTVDTYKWQWYPDLPWLISTQSKLANPNSELAGISSWQVETTNLHNLVLANGIQMPIAAGYILANPGVIRVGGLV